MLKRGHIVLLIIFVLLFLDQWLKIWVKLNMVEGQSFEVLGLSWFQIHFVENPGMAFGINWGNSWGKLALSLFRLIAVTALGIYLYRLTRQKKPWALLTGLAFVFAGAFGNLIDGTFYGLFFTDSTYNTATWAASGQGYAGLFYGKVVDMFYFPFFEGQWPGWVPFVGGSHFEFFNAIFNIADSAVFVGVCTLLIFNKQLMTELNSLRWPRWFRKTKIEKASSSME